MGRGRGKNQLNRSAVRVSSRTSSSPYTRNLERNKSRNSQRQDESTGNTNTNNSTNSNEENTQSQTSSTRQGESDGKPIRVWCLGSSIIKWAATQAHTRFGGTGMNLGLERLNMSIWWQGYGGLCFTDLKRKLCFLATIELSVPDILIIHCGGNDIGKLKLVNFRHLIRTTLKFIRNKFPETLIIWSQILPRKHHKDGVALSKQRARINSCAASVVLNMGGAYIKYPEIKFNSKSLFRKDEIHLSNVGNSIFLNTIQAALEFFQKGFGKVYPP